MMTWGRCPARVGPITASGATRRLSRILRWSLVVAPFTWGALASAQTSPADATRADALFESAVKLFEAGSTHQACQKFAESMSLDPANGTLQNLALCHEKEGKTASAWHEFTQLAERAARDRQAERERLGREKAAALSARLSRLSLSMQPESNVADIRVDGAPLDHDSWTDAIPLDPGQHSLTLSAPGKKTMTVAVTMAPGPSTGTVVVARLDDEKAQPEGDEPAPATPSGGLGSQRTIALALGGVGVVGVVAGSVFGLMASSKWSQAKNDCSPQCGPSSPPSARRATRRPTRPSRPSRSS